MMTNNGLNVALQPFLLDCPAVITLGLRSALAEYTPQQRSMLLRSQWIFFPSMRFVDVFNAAGKRTFPRFTTYRYQRDRLLQHNLFGYLDIPRCRAKPYFGSRQKEKIAIEFRFPLWISDSRSVYKPRHYVQSQADLEMYVDRYSSVVVEEFIPYEFVIQLLVVNYEMIGARQVICCGKERVFEFIEVERKSLEVPVFITLKMVKAANLDDIVVEWGFFMGRWYCLRLLRPPAIWSTTRGRLSRHQLICKMIMKGGFE